MRSTLWPAVFAVIFFAGPLRADETQRAAQALFDEGRALMVAERWPEACDRFERSEALAPAVGTLLNLGLCYEKQEKFASAHATYEQAVALATKRGEATRAAFGRDRLTATAAKLAYVTVTVADGAPADLELFQDGAPLPKLALGVAIPTDLGPHAIEARAPGHVSQTIAFRLAAHDRASVVVPVLEKQAPPPPPLVVELGPGPLALAPPPPPPPPPPPVVLPRTTSPFRSAGWITLSVGAAALATGIGLGVAAKVDYDGADCSGALCSPVGVSRRERAFDLAGASTGLFVVSGALAVLGVTFLVVPLGPRAPAVAIGPGALGLRGSF